MWSPQVESLDEISVRFYYFLSVLILLSSSFVSITAMMSFIAFMSVQNLSRSDLVREVEVGEVVDILASVLRGSEGPDCVFVEGDIDGNYPFSVTTASGVITITPFLG